jgi:acyl dehydratase
MTNLVFAPKRLRLQRWHLSSIADPLIALLVSRGITVAQEGEIVQSLQVEPAVT